MTDFLFRDSWSQMRVSPVSLALAVPKRRSGSPTRGCSILMTSAPNSARRVPQKGAARNVAMSRTRTPSIGRTAPALPYAPFDSFARPPREASPRSVIPSLLRRDGVAQHPDT